MIEEKERLSKTDIASMIVSDENIIRKVLDEVISEQSAQKCAIPITFDRKKYDGRKQREIIEIGI